MIVACRLNLGGGGGVWGVGCGVRGPSTWTPVVGLHALVGTALRVGDQNIDGPTPSAQKNNAFGNLPRKHDERDEREAY